MFMTLYLCTRAHYMLSVVVLVWRCSQFMSHSLEPVSTYKLLKSNMNDILWKVLLPVLSFGPLDQKRWVEDPEEYVRGLNDPMGTLTDPRVAATEFIIQMLKVC